MKKLNANRQRELWYIGLAPQSEDELVMFRRAYHCPQHLLDIYHCMALIKLCKAGSTGRVADLLENINWPYGAVLLYEREQV